MTWRRWKGCSIGLQTLGHSYRVSTWPPNVDLVQPVFALGFDIELIYSELSCADQLTLLSQSCLWSQTPYLYNGNKFRDATYAIRFVSLATCVSVGVNHHRTYMPYCRRTNGMATYFSGMVTVGSRTAGVFQIQCDFWHYKASKTSWIQCNTETYFGSQFSGSLL